MMHRNISMPELGLIAGTRAILGAGVGLLLADQIKPEHRRTIGWTLVAVGALSTVPLAADILLRHKPHADPNEHDPEPGPGSTFSSLRDTF